MPAGPSGRLDIWRTCHRNLGLHGTGRQCQLGAGQDQARCRDLVDGQQVAELDLELRGDAGQEVAELHRVGDAGVPPGLPRLARRDLRGDGIGRQHELPPWVDHALDREVVHGQQIGQGDLVQGRDSHQEVTVLHGVHHRPGHRPVGAVAAGVGAAAPAGTTSLSPGRIRLFLVRWLALSRSARATPSLAAMPARKSPFFTTYCGGCRGGRAGGERRRGQGQGAERDGRKGDSQQRSLCPRHANLSARRVRGPLRILDTFTIYTMPRTAKSMRPLTDRHQALTRRVAPARQGIRSNGPRWRRRIARVAASRAGVPLPAAAASSRCALPRGPPPGWS